MSAFGAIYRRFGAAPLINAAGTKSRLGGARMPAEVVAAMAEAAEAGVDMAVLQAAASRTIARLTGAEAGYVTTGAAAALTLSAAAALAGLDPARMARLPDARGMPNRLLIVRAHRNAYDLAWRAAGAELVDVGLDDRLAGAGVRGVEAWELDAAIDDRTAGIAYVANRRDDPPLAMVARVARAHGLPLLVDAAAQLPPVENLGAFIAAGADLVAFSGGKAIGGPAATGVLAGRRDLIQSVALQQLDLDVDRRVWRLPASLFPDGEPADLPRHGIGRGFKVGKEQVIGLLVALERFADGALAREAAGREALAAELAAAAIADGVRVRVLPHHGLPRVELTFAAPVDAARLLLVLEEGDPGVAIDPTDLGAGVVTIDTVNLDDADGARVVAALRRALRPPRRSGA